ncbi:hypothetical protein [Actinomadura sp. 6K520]|jgi:hypothetical protein|uniref:hypothetical protein n=1 Tax=Actinomadura sp. 6K520 TaxID=2530364 RepID=UPI001404E1F4|nr:hypothetical protein [Actinomadura sp. 6K520]
MSRDTHPGAQCPHCQSHLALVPVPGNSAATAVPLLPVVQKEEWQPPPVAEVLAVYAGRAKDTVTAARGAAKVRESLNRARANAAQRRAAQKAARHTPRSA